MLVVIWMKILVRVIIWVTVMDDEDIEKMIPSLQLVSSAIFSLLAFEITLSGLPCKECSCIILFHPRMF